MTLHKLGGTIHLIAVGSVFHHFLTTKVVCFALGDDLGQFLYFTQLGFGTPGGCGATVYAASELSTSRLF